MTTVVWRHDYSPEALRQLQEMKTLDSFTVEVDARFTKPHEIMEAAVNLAHRDSSGEWFSKEESIVVLEPASLAGTWTVSVDWEPTFSARRARPPASDPHTGPTPRSQHASPA